MPVYIIAYDISKDPQQPEEYKSLDEALERMKAHRAQESVFVVRDNRTGQEIATDLAAHIKHKTTNRLLVSEINKNTFWRFPLNEEEINLFFDDAFDNLSKIAAMYTHPLGNKP